ncbi:MAG: asparagine synthetase B, partial [Candidatus Omnitrophica bacterium]|nr:asparagine synthetase B [Candidatus Omnitrophota bacterium]
MCGICGIYNYKTRLKVAEHSIKVMCDTMFHRGPNDEGMHLDSELGIGMRRLSIIDIEGGHQPIFNEDRTICVIFNGEIYNYIELRETLKSRHSFTTNSDTECIVHLYEEYGDDFVNRLNGMFGIALWDNNKKRLLIIRDRFGIKPLFYSLTPDGIIFASEINALLKIEGVDKEMDFKGLSNYFSYYYFPSPLTIYKGIKKLLPAHLLIINSAGMEV